METNEEKRPIKPPQIPIKLMPQTVLIHQIQPISKVERDLKKNTPDLILSKDILTKTIKDKIESTNDILAVWEEHPYQGIVVACSLDVQENNDIRVGDHIAFGPENEGRSIVVFDKKKYYTLRPFQVLFRYLTDKV